MIPSALVEIANYASQNQFLGCYVQFDLAGRCAIIKFPLLLIALPGLAIILVNRLNRRKLRYREINRLCMNCGYPTIGLTLSVCPECGLPFSLRPGA
ncbi:hypothetical protein B7486_05325 [cyanobacterium TDX16]|nr:hypothetical protein B7486_05325 [cyanobacterium TDX16]